MRVWVPIDLPDGWTVERAFCHDTYGSAKWLRAGEPLLQDPHPEPHRERWEYKVAQAHVRDCDALGAEGWEAFLGDNGWLWFKRRLA